MEKKTGSLKERFNNTNDYSFLEKEARCEGEGNVNYRHFDARIDAASLKQYEEFNIRVVCVCVQRQFLYACRRTMLRFGFVSLDNQA